MACYSLALELMIKRQVSFVDAKYGASSAKDVYCDMKTSPSVFHQTIYLGSDRCKNQEAFTSFEQEFDSDVCYDTDPASNRPTSTSSLLVACTIGSCPSSSTTTSADMTMTGALSSSTSSFAEATPKVQNET